MLKKIMEKIKLLDGIYNIKYNVTAPDGDVYEVTTMSCAKYDVNKDITQQLAYWTKEGYMCTKIEIIKC